MNTTKIAAFYPYFLDALRQLPAGRNLADMLYTVQQALALKANAGNATLWVTLRDQDNPVQRFNELGMATDEELCEAVPARVFEWVYAQQPPLPVYSDDREGIQAQYEAYQQAKTGWQVTANEVMPAPLGIAGHPVPSTTDKGRYAVWTGSTRELAGLLRGLRAHRAKRRKQTRRLVHQLWAYHRAQQQLAQQTAQQQATASALAALAEGCLLGCLYLPLAEQQRREELAEDLEEQKQQQCGNVARYGREILWHPDFAAHWQVSIGKMSLHLVAPYLDSQFAKDYNQGRALDLADYCFLADCLREALADTPESAARLRLARALAWVEHKGAAFLPTEQPRLTASPPAAALALAA